MKKSRRVQYTILLGIVYWFIWKILFVTGILGLKIGFGFNISHFFRFSFLLGLIALLALKVDRFTGIPYVFIYSFVIILGNFCNDLYITVIKYHAGFDLAEYLSVSLSFYFLALIMFGAVGGLISIMVNKLIRLLRKKSNSSSRMT